MFWGDGYSQRTLRPPDVFPQDVFSFAFLHTRTFFPSPYVWRACVAFLPESDVVLGMQLSAARLRYRRGGDRQATDAASDLLQRLTTTTTTTAPLFRASRCIHWCGAPSSHCNSVRPRARHCCRMHARGQPPAKHLEMFTQIPQRQLHTICAARRDG